MLKLLTSSQPLISLILVAISLLAFWQLFSAFGIRLKFLLVSRLSIRYFFFLLSPFYFFFCPLFLDSSWVFALFLIVNGTELFEFESHDELG